MPRLNIICHKALRMPVFLRKMAMQISEKLTRCGVRQWTDEAKGFRYIVLLFKTNRFSGELKSSDEGKVFWIDKKDIVKYALADGFEEVLEMFENDALSENYWWMENGEWKYKNL